MSKRKARALPTELPAYKEPDSDEETGMHGERLYDDPQPNEASGHASSMSTAENEQHVSLMKMMQGYPAASQELHSQEVLSHIQGMVSKVPIRLPTLEVASKSYEDTFLRPPNLVAGERGCVLGKDCLCAFLGKKRFPESDPRIFVCVEFLRPSQQQAWIQTGKLPEHNDKCLLCIRYWTSYMYHMMRGDPSFRVNVEAETELMHHTNQVEGANEEEIRLLKAIGFRALPTHVNTTDVRDGYGREALLYVDEEAANMAEIRKGKTSALVWRPFVRFDASHYSFELVNGSPRVVQVNVGVHLNDVPPPDSVGSKAAASMRPRYKPSLRDA